MRRISCHIRLVQSAIGGFAHVNGNRASLRDMRSEKHHQAGFVSVLGLLFAFVVIGVVVMVQQSFSQISQGQRVKAQTITLPQARTGAITSKVLGASSWNGPYIVVVGRSDGSYTYAYVVDATLIGSRFIGDVTLRYANGDYGIVKESQNGFDFFLTKRGLREPVQIIDRLVTGASLENGVILPAQVANGRVISDSLVGEFDAYLYTDKYHVVASRDANGNMSSVSVEPTVISLDVTQGLISRETLKLALRQAGIDNNNVLGESTDDQSSLSSPAIASPRYTDHSSYSLRALYLL